MARQAAPLCLQAVFTFQSWFIYSLKPPKLLKPCIGKKRTLSRQSRGFRGIKPGHKSVPLFIPRPHACHAILQPSKRTTSTAKGRGGSSEQI